MRKKQHFLQFVIFHLFNQFFSLIFSWKKRKTQITAMIFGFLRRRTLLFPAFFTERRDLRLRLRRLMRRARRVLRERDPRRRRMLCNQGEKNHQQLFFRSHWQGTTNNWLQFLAEKTICRRYNFKALTRPLFQWTRFRVLVSFHQQ